MSSFNADIGNVTFNGKLIKLKVVDVAADSVIVEISGTENKIEAFIDMIRPLGILELVRTGRSAMVRGSSTSCENSEMEPSSET